MPPKFHSLSYEDLEQLKKSRPPDSSVEFKDYEVIEAPAIKLLKQHRQRVRSIVPQLRRTDVEDRSNHHYRVACSLLEAGLPFDHVVKILLETPSVKSKTESRNAVEYVWTTVMKAHDHVGRNGNGNGHHSDEDVEDELVTVTASDVELKNVVWLWNKWIPQGNLTILAGRQGSGKSQWTAWLAARLSKGELKKGPRKCHPPSDVLFASLEDAVSETIAPRLKGALANMKRVHIVTCVTRDGERDVLRLPRDVELIVRRAREVKAKLVVIDPLNAALGGGNNWDSYRDTDVRAALAPLTQAAAENGFAVVAVMHLKKSQENDAMMGVLGSVAYTAAARSVIVMGYDKESEAEEDRVLVHAKSNLGPLQISKRLTIKPTRRVAKGGKTIITSRVWTRGESGVEAHEVSSTPTTSSKVDEAKNFLISELTTAPKGKYAVKLQERAAEKGIAPRTLKRARLKLGVTATNARGPGTHSVWRLPDVK